MTSTPTGNAHALSRRATARSDPDRTVAHRRQGLAVRFRQDWPFLLLCLPAVAQIVLFNYVPLLGNVTAFQEYSPYDGILHSQVVGFWQFGQLFQDADFWRSVGNTLFFTLLQTLAFFPICIGLALLLNGIRQRWARSLVQSVLYLPHFLSWVVVVTLFTRTLGGAGLLNQALGALGLSPLTIISNPTAFPGLIVFQSMWKDGGWGMIIFLAALGSVASELHEAAAVDGAGRWRRLFHITLPALRPVVILLLIMRLGDALNVGFEQFLLQRDAVGATASEVVDTYVYYNGLLQGELSYGAAAGLFKGVIGLVLILAANRLAHSVGEDGIYRSVKR